MKAGPGSVNPASATFQAAQSACQGLLGKNAPKGALSTHSGGPAGGRGANGGFSVESGPSGG